MLYQNKCFTNAQFAVWAVRWPCGILAIAVKTLSHVFSSFPSNRTNWDKCMLNDISRHKFQDMPQLVWLEGKHTAQTAHCELRRSDHEELLH